MENEETITVGAKYVPLNASAIVDTLESKTGLVEKWFCRVCGKQQPTQALATAHEDKHVYPTDGKFTIYYEIDDTYPTTVQILMEDGRRIVYTLERPTFFK